jgi:hypothetical protein
LILNHGGLGVAPLQNATTGRGFVVKWRASDFILSGGNMRPILIAIVVWMGLIGAAAAFGGFMSLYTGKASELPKWNGWSYLIFCAEQGAMFGAVLTWPIALVVFFVARVGSRQRDAAWAHQQEKN